jgi:ferric-dicitrate binding protein FerR (iron transport regulator)
VAAAVAVIAAGFWLYDIPDTSNTSTEHRKVAAARQNDVDPGKNTATLTLSSGKVIHLDTNKTSVVVTDSVKKMMMLTASTPRGGTYQITLPDGTQVWLNADTKITFPSQFIGQERRVILEGEAYFSVTHNKQKPFIVKTEEQEVTVLGTEFNINAYKDENKTLTTLLTGSVSVHAATQATLVPGQQSSLWNGQLKVQKADLESATSWKNGVFLFYNLDMKAIMRQLARWYNVEIDINTIPESRYYGEISRDVKLSEVLTMLEATGNIQFKIEGRRVMLAK